MKTDLAACDAILIPGDLVDRHRRNNRNAEAFLKEAPDLAPVFYAIGNHERKFRLKDTWLQKIRESRGVTLLAKAWGLDDF